MDGAEVVEGCGGMGIRLLALFEGFQCAFEEVFGRQEIFFLISQHSCRIERLPILSFGDAKGIQAHHLDEQDETQSKRE